MRYFLRGAAGAICVLIIAAMFALVSVVSYNEGRLHEQRCIRHQDCGE